MNENPTGPTLLHVRFYAQHIHPNHFRGSGFRGFLIRVLNQIRYWLETRVQRLALGHFLRVSRENGATITPADATQTVRKFWEDVRSEEKLVQGKREPEIPEGVALVPRSLRYHRGRTVLAEEQSDVPKETGDITEMVRRYGAKPNQRRYGVQRKVVMEAGDEFEAIPGVQTPPDTAGPPEGLPFVVGTKRE